MIESCATAALDYAARGWRVFPLHSVSGSGACTCGDPACGSPAKHPRTKNGVSDASADPSIVTEWWSKWPGANIGIATGAASGIVVLDIDPRHGGKQSLTQLEARIGDLHPTVTARTGGGGHHLFFKHPGAVRVPCKVGLAGLSGIDVRADGGYVCEAPSRHASGNPYLWEAGPDEIELQPLPAPLLEIIIAPNANGAGHAKAASREPISEGQRNAHLTSLAGSMRRRGMTGAAMLAALLTENQTRCAPPLPDAEVRAIAKSVSRYEPAEPEPRQRPEIVIGTDASRVVDEAEDALLQAGGIYSRSRFLIEISQDKARRLPWLVRAAGAPAIIPINPSRLCELMADAATWIAVSKKKDGEAKDGDAEKPRPRARALPPAFAVNMLAGRPSWRFPEIAMLTESPMLRPDGTVIQHAGYDEATGVLYKPCETFPVVPDAPTLADAKAAIVALGDPLKDFPFAESDRSAALAAILTLAARPAIAGPVPMFGIDAPIQASGKTLLANTISLIGTGRPAPKMAAPQDEGEMRKCLLAVAIEGLSVMLLDNLTAPLRSASLSAALTAVEWRDRMLGRNETITAPLVATWIATGNNLSYGSDVARRVIPIRLDPKREDPEAREGFAYPDLLAHIERERSRLVTAALTILRGYCAAGRPTHGKAPMGSFEQWDRLVRGALLWAGEPDPLFGRERVRSESDIEGEALRGALEQWFKVFESEPMTAAAAVQRAASRDGEGVLLYPDLSAALAELAAVEPGKLSARCLGYALRKVRDHRKGGKHFDHAATATDNGVRWYVVTG